MSRRAALQLTGHVRSNWLSYLLGALALLVTSTTEVLMPKFIQWTVDILTQKDMHVLPAIFSSNSTAVSLDRLMFGFIVTLLIGWIGRVGWRQLMARRTHEAGHQLKVKFWDTLKDQPMSFLDKYPLGDLMNRATADWNRTRFIHGFTMVLSFDLIFFSLLALVSMFIIDIPLTLACLLLVPFLPKSLIRLSRREYEQHEIAQHQLSELSDAISQSVNTARLQRASNSEAIWEEHLNRRAVNYASEQLKVLKTGWKIFIIGALPTLFAYIALFSFGIYRIQTGHISIGEFIALQSYIVLLQSPLFELGSAISEWQTGFASFARLLEIFDFKKNTNLEKISGASRFQHNSVVDLEAVNFRYQKDYKLKNISLKISKGEKIGITGPIGSGKSTLLGVIGGLIDLDKLEGKVELFGQDIRKLSRQQITSRVNIITQRPFLFAGSIRYNLCLDENHSDEQLIEVLKIVRLWEDVQQMSQQLDTWIGEWGINLSGGQKQRLSIARALLRPSELLILDDCLSAVDSVTEEHILRALSERFKEQTLIWTAHRTSTLQLCERVYHLDMGSIETRGNYSLTSHRQEPSI